MESIKDPIYNWPWNSVYFLIDNQVEKELISKGTRALSTLGYLQVCSQLKNLILEQLEEDIENGKY
jgi:hypothetical protein